MMPHQHYSGRIMLLPGGIEYRIYVAPFSLRYPSMDVWSIGCIFAEVLLGEPLFSGKNVVHQLELITDLLGTPSPEAVKKICNEKARCCLASMPEKAPVPLAKKFLSADPAALSLLERLLAFNPKERPSAKVICVNAEIFQQILMELENAFATRCRKHFWDNVASRSFLM
ncbi:hypothetical protein L7F22_055691 [Adiantum nelumboides]|nr:hypothetical protein [Adiantum nelumboides]